MLTDADNLLADEQAVTVTAASTNYIDLKAEGLGDTPRKLVITVDEAAVAAGAATVVFALQVDTDAGFATALRTVVSSEAFGKAVLTIGRTPIQIPLPPFSEEFVRAYVTVATGPLTAGKFTMQLLQDVPTSPRAV